MPDQILFRSAFGALESALDISHKRNDVISSNISNLETPGYKARDIDFKTAMAQAMGGEPETGLAVTDKGHMGAERGVDPEPFEEAGEWNGYNWMSVDNTMNKLTENNMIYRTATEVLLRKIVIMKDVIREGGR
jgi:flagellar basal-body rod protein FlgB